MSDNDLDALIDSFAKTRRIDGTEGEGSSVAGPSRASKKDVTYEDFQKVLDSTPLFMRETPEGSEDNPVLEALRSLVFEGDGDGGSSVGPLKMERS